MFYRSFFKALPGARPYLRVVAILFTIVANCSNARADGFDNLRNQWSSIIVGPTTLSTSDPDVAASVSGTAASADAYWKLMNTTTPKGTVIVSGATALFSDITGLSTASNAGSGAVDASFGRLKVMAMAYAQPQNWLYQNADLGIAIRAGLDWLYTNYYNQNHPSGSAALNAAEYGNWYDWQIGDSQNLLNAALLVYNQLTPAEIANYSAAIDYFIPNPSYNDFDGIPRVATGSNLTDLCLSVILRGILAKDASKITTAEADLAPVFATVTSGDGFYSDGSFVFHGAYAYNGGYGATTFGDVTNLLLLLNSAGSAYPLTGTSPSGQTYDEVVWGWITNSFLPLIATGAMPDMVGGRDISRCMVWDHSVGRSVIVSLARISTILPSSEATTLEGLIKSWIANDTTWNGYTNPCNGAGSVLPSSPESSTYSDYYAGLSPFDVVNLESITSPNNSVAATSPTPGNYNFAAMDKVVHVRPGFTFGLSMSSSKINDFECTNGENKGGFYTGLGSTYLYDADLEQYDNNYWATIDPARLAGVTTDGSLQSPSCNGESYVNPETWVGGSVVDGVYGSSGMQINYAPVSGVSYLPPVSGSTLSGQKSWFWFADKMVALGTNISDSTSGKPVETIVDNRMIDAGGDNSLIVNGTIQPTIISSMPTILSNVTWAYEDGNVADSGIGYYFPQVIPSLAVKRETRTGMWSTINSYYPLETAYSNNFLSLAVEHGSTPAGAGYAYVVLPNQTAASMASYAATPDVVILENSNAAQAVFDASANSYGVNFWGSVSHTVLDQYGYPLFTSASPASVTTVQNGSEMDIAISDPTQSNTGTIVLTISRSGSLISSDPGVTVTTGANTITVSANVSGAAGHSFQAKLHLNAVILQDTADAFVENASDANTNYGTQNSLTVKDENSSGGTRVSYLKFNVSTVTQPITKAVVYITPFSLGQTSGITNQASVVSDNSWNETGITWDNAPAPGTVLSTWTVPGTTGTPVTVDVTSLAQSAQSNGNVFSIAISSPTFVGDNGEVYYASKEYGSYNFRPYLIISTQ